MGYCLFSPLSFQIFCELIICFFFTFKNIRDTFKLSFNSRLTLIAEWSEALPQIAHYFSPLPGFKFQQRMWESYHANDLGLGGGFTSIGVLWLPPLVTTWRSLSQPSCNMAKRGWLRIIKINLSNLRWPNTRSNATMHMCVCRGSCTHVRFFPGSPIASSKATYRCCV